MPSYSTCNNWMQL